jgi:hypothetical protein
MVPPADDCVMRNTTLHACLDRMSIAASASAAVGISTTSMLLVMVMPRSMAAWMKAAAPLAEYESRAFTTHTLL